MNNEMILVDMQDREIGTADKETVHAEGRLHRAFSVFLFSKDGEKLLLQRRAYGKYHCGGLWTNTCCSHPRKGENLIDSAKNRLKEEMGIQIDSLEESGCFVYRCRFSNGVTEFEYDHILTGYYDGGFTCDPEEVTEAKWVLLPDLREHIAAHPDEYTPWFITALSLIDA